MLPVSHMYLLNFSACSCTSQVPDKTLAPDDSSRQAQVLGLRIVFSLACTAVSSNEEGHQDAESFSVFVTVGICYASSCRTESGAGSF